MSRSALWRQEGNVKERERQAEELFRLAVEEGRNNRAKNLVPMWGPDDSFHFNPMLLQNIIKSPYFQKCCRDITDWNTLVDQIYYDVKHLEPWAQGKYVTSLKGSHTSYYVVLGTEDGRARNSSNREPSSAFCLLLRLLTLRCTEKQMTLLLTHADSPYIRAIGFLYLRFAGDPKCVYKWIEPYIYDDETIQAGASSAKQGGASETMGKYVRRIFTEKSYYGTILPRLPIEIERDVQVKLLQAEKIELRAQKHGANPKTMNHFQTLGSKVMALYGDEDNPLTWYEAMVDRVVTTDPETQQKLRHPKFVVTFTEYGNTETVSLGEMEMTGASLDSASNEAKRGGYAERNYTRVDDRSGISTHRGGDRSRGYGDHSHTRGHASSHDRGYVDRARNLGGQNDRGQRECRPPPPAALEADLYEEVRRRERETVTSSSRNAVARRPPSAKASLSVIGDNMSKRSRSPDGYHRPSPQQRNDRVVAAAASHSARAPPNGEKASEELAAIRAKKQKLLAKYG